MFRFFPARHLLSSFHIRISSYHDLVSFLFLLSLIYNYPELSFYRIFIFSTEQQPDKKINTQRRLAYIHMMGEVRRLFEIQSTNLNKSFDYQERAIYRYIWSPTWSTTGTVFFLSFLRLLFLLIVFFSRWMFALVFDICAPACVFYISKDTPNVRGRIEFLKHVLTTTAAAAARRTTIYDNR